MSRPAPHYDLFVIGTGSGGVRAARVAAGFGVRVAIAEAHRFGGTCVVRGCVPKKLLASAAHYREDFDDAAFGWTAGEPRFSWARLIANKNREIARLSGVYRELLERAGVAMLHGSATLIDRHTVAIGGARVTAAHIVVATGSRPHLPDVPGIEHAITSNEAFELAELPRRVLVVGGGYIAVEFAGILNGLGANVVLSYRGEQILRGFDDDVRAHLSAEMSKKGVDTRVHSDVSRIDRRADGALEIRFRAARRASLVVDAVMYATGRVPNTAGLGLATLGVALDVQGGIVTDAWCRSSVPGLYAIGDVTNRIALTPVAIREGQAVATTLFGGVETPIDHDYVPSAVFSQPPVGTVGLTESAALARFGHIDVYRSCFRPLRHALTGRDERTLIKLVVDATTQRVVGAHMVGADAPEIVQGFAVAVKMGATKADFDATTGIHPTAAEEFVTLREMITRRTADAERVETAGSTGTR